MSIKIKLFKHVYFILLEDIKTSESENEQRCVWLGFTVHISVPWHIFKRKFTSGIIQSWKTTSLIKHHSNSNRIWGGYHGTTVHCPSFVADSISAFSANSFWGGGKSNNFPCVVVKLYIVSLVVHGSGLNSPGNSESFINRDAQSLSFPWLN